MPKSTRANLHAQRLKQIRPFINFDYDLRKSLSNSAKRKIKRYFDEIDALTNRPYQVYRPRRKDHLREAQEFAQHATRLPALKVAFIPTSGAPVKLSFNKRGVTARSGHVATTDIRLSKRGLINDAKGYTTFKVATRPDSQQFTVQAGRYEIAQPYPKYAIPDAVARLCATYSNPEDNHYFGNWLHGLKAYTFHDQAELFEYFAAKREAIKNAKKARRRRARKARRAREQQ